MLDINKLTTESNNPISNNIHKMNGEDIARLMNDEDKGVPYAIEKELSVIGEGIETIAEAFSNEGRLLYYGCGTSGRLGVLDASECPPTFGVSPKMVVGIIAGGDSCLRNPSEAAEDNLDLAQQDFEQQDVTNKDVVVGISASGRSPYVIHILKQANAVGAKTIGLCNNKVNDMEGVANVVIAVDAGPEIIQGSTRLKSGTTQKLILNMLTTGAMIRIGKVYKNFMVDMTPVNEKLYARAISLVSRCAECDEAHSKMILEKCNYHIKTAIYMILTNCDVKTATEVLAKASGHLGEALETDKE